MITFGQVTVGTAATFITSMPPGPCTLTLVVNNTVSGTAPAATPIYVGGTNTVTVSNGAPVLGNSSITYTGFQGSRAMRFWAAAGGNTPVGFHLCSDG